MTQALTTSQKLKQEAKIGEILLNQTSLTEAQLREALAIQKDKGGKLGDILIQKKFLQPHEIIIALSLQVGIPYLKEIEVNAINPDWVQDIPIAYARQMEILPIALDDVTVTVAVSDPFNFQHLDDLKVIFQKEIRPVLCEGRVILDGINRVYERIRQSIMSEISEEESEEFQYDLEEPVDLLEASENDAPVIRFVNNLLFRAIKDKASDIHIEPYEKEMVVRLRIDGVLYDVARPPKGLHAGISSRIKLMGELDIAEKRLPQDGRIKIKIAGKDVDLRLSVIPTAHGERLVLRILDKSSVRLDLAVLGFDPETIKHINQLIHKKHGIILVTGPTGSGKTTSLYSCITRINSIERNIITVEDPIEYDLKGVAQIQVNPKIGLSFASGLRAILRQDPDVIMVGEIRDKETAEIAIQASLTGHLVFATIHTNDAPGAITRLIDMGVEPFLVSSSLMAVLAQRLMRKACPNCKEEYTPQPAELDNLGLDTNVFGGKHIIRTRGCVECTGTGYKGRMVVHELMMIDDEIRTLIMNKADSSVIKKEAMTKGMITLRQNGIQKVLDQVTTAIELVSVTQE
ncbi:MAG: type II secretion system protein GspE [Proteobacteria bacterium]|nr:type II secretion system protein GspE [Pseudomonadota bacterium]NDC23418.1 type II secretion system protein GspE [Pseudomonadota bacterium]NDD03587.1 type II secretion system protein GspE [Pseudomonadota bacterium]NDG25683.1 type II secretion system protein GspE [Pseudomonadota bacterium]